MATGQCWENLRPWLQLLLPLCVHWIAEEMIVSVLVDVTTNALCPGRKTCPHAIHISGQLRTVVGVFKMLVLPLLSQLADEYRPKPLLILVVSTNIIPLTLLAFDESKGSVYAYYVLWTISYIIRQGSLFCISVARAADVVDDSNGPFSESQVRENVLARFLQNNDIFEADVFDDSEEDDGECPAAFSWIIVLFCASQFMGNVLARLLPRDYIFEVSIVLLVLVPVYMTLFLTETVIFTWNRRSRNSVDSFFRINNIHVVTSSSTLKCISLVSFFYKLGMSGISSVLLYYLKSAFGFNKNQFSEILMVVRAGSFLSKCLNYSSKIGIKVETIFPQVFHLPNHLNGEKLILCAALLASIAYGLLYGLAWASWVPYLSASFGLIYGLVKPSITRAVKSKASNSEVRRNAQGFVVVVQSIASLLSPLVMTPLTTWFLSSDAPFDCKGFSIIFASISMVISLCYAWTLKLDAPSNRDNTENIEEALLSDNTENVEGPLLSDNTENIEGPLLS